MRPSKCLIDWVRKESLDKKAEREWMMESAMMMITQLVGRDDPYISIQFNEMDTDSLVLNYFSIVLLTY